MALIIVLLRLSVILQPVVVVVVIVAHPVSIPLRHRLALDLDLLFLAHPMYLLLKKFHLLEVSVPYLIFLPFFVLSALLAPLAEDVEAVQILHQLELIVEIDFTIVLAARADPCVAEVLHAIQKEFVIVAQSIEST